MPTHVVTYTDVRAYASDIIPGDKIELLPPSHDMFSMPRWYKVVSVEADGEDHVQFELSPSWQSWEHGKHWWNRGHWEDTKPSFNVDAVFDVRVTRREPFEE